MNNMTEAERVAGTLRIRAEIAGNEGEHTFAKLLDEAAEMIAEVHSAAIEAAAYRHDPYLHDPFEDEDDTATLDDDYHVKREALVARFIAAYDEWRAYIWAGAPENSHNAALAHLRDEARRELHEFDMRTGRI